MKWCRGAELNCLRRPFQGRALPVSYLGTGTISDFTGAARACQFGLKSANTRSLAARVKRKSGTVRLRRCGRELTRRNSGHSIAAPAADFFRGGTRDASPIETAKDLRGRFVRGRDFLRDGALGDWSYAGEAKRERRRNRAGGRPFRIPFAQVDSRRRRYVL